MLSKSWKLIRNGVLAAVLNADQFVVLAAGVFFAIAGPAGWIGTETLTAAIAAVLSVLALSLLRDRYHREKLAREATQALSRTVQAVTGDFPYHAVRVAVTWTLEDPDAEIANVVAERELRFIRNNVHAIHIWSQPSGAVTNQVVEGKRKGTQTFKPLQLCAPFLDRGKRRRTVSLQDMLNAGEEYVIKETRTLRGSFRDNPERAAFTVEAPTDTVVLKVVWPNQRRPSELYFLRSRDKTGRSSDRVGRVRASGKQKYTYSTEVVDPVQGEELSLEWFW